MLRARLEMLRLVFAEEVRDEVTAGGDGRARSGRAAQKYHSSRVGDASVLTTSKCVARKESAMYHAGLNCLATPTTSSNNFNTVR